MGGDDIKYDQVWSIMITYDQVIIGYSVVMTYEVTDDFIRHLGKRYVLCPEK